MVRRPRNTCQPGSNEQVSHPVPPIMAPPLPATPAPCAHLQPPSAHLFLSNKCCVDVRISRRAALAAASPPAMLPPGPTARPPPTRPKGGWDGSPRRRGALRAPPGGDADAWTSPTSPLTVEADPAAAGSARGLACAGLHVGECHRAQSCCPATARWAAPAPSAHGGLGAWLL